MTEQDILGFNPQDLFNTNEETSTVSNPLIYKTRPSDSKSEDGIYRAKIKIIYNPENPKNSILEQQSYGMQDTTGYFSAVSSLTVNDKNCPIFTAWKKCHYAQEGSTLYNQALSKEKGGKQLFDKRFARYVIVQILRDKNQPELVGSFKLWKLPTSIYTMLQQKMNPSKESGKTSIPVMDYLFGRAINIEVHPGPDDKSNPQRKTREITYLGEISNDVVSCINPDGSPILNDEEQSVLDAYINKMNKVWNMECEDDEQIAQRNQLIQSINSSEEFKALVPIYTKVLNEIKEWAPKLESLSYKEWNDNLKKRVNDWIEVVLSGNDPAHVSIDDLKKMKDGIAPITPETSSKVEFDNQPANPMIDSVTPSTTDPADDLPF